MSRATSWMDRWFGCATSSLAALLLLVAPVHGLATGLPLCCRVDARCAASDHCPLKAAPAAQPSCHAMNADHEAAHPAGEAAAVAHIGAPRHCSAPCCTATRTPPAQRQDIQLDGGRILVSPDGSAAPVVARSHRSTSLLTVQSWRGPPSLAAPVQSVG